MQSNDNKTTKIENLLIKCFPEAESFQRGYNPLLAKYIGKLEALIFSQMEFLLRSTDSERYNFHGTPYIVASYEMIAEKWFCKTESYRSIKRAIKHLIDLRIVEKVPMSHKHNGANCYLINYTTFEIVMKAFQEGRLKQAIPDRMTEKECKDMVRANKMDDEHDRLSSSADLSSLA